MGKPKVEAPQGLVWVVCDRCGERAQCLGHPFGAVGYMGLCNRRDLPYRRCGGRLIPEVPSAPAVLRSDKIMSASEKDEADLEKMLEPLAEDIGRED